MKQTNVTVVGHVATEPRLRETPAGTKVTNFRLATNERRFDRSLKEWRDVGTMFFSVSCWRGMAENVYSSVQKGQPIIVEGRLHTSSYDDHAGTTRTTLEIDATSIGHDLARGVSSFTKADPGPRAERELAAQFAREHDQDEPPVFDPVTGELLDGEPGDRYVSTELAG